MYGNGPHMAMLFGSPELWIGETSVRQREVGGDVWTEYAVVVDNRGSADATGCAADLTMRGVYDGLSEGRYRFAIEQPGRWIRESDSTAVTIPDGESVAMEAFRVVDGAGADAYEQVEFPTDAGDDEPPVDRYLVEDGNVKRFDQSDHVPLPVFAATEWETVTLSVTAENHGTVEREFEVGSPDGDPEAIDGVRFDVDFDDEESVPSFKTF